MLAQISIHDDTGERTQGTERVDEIAVSPLVREFVRLRVMEFHADLKLDVGMLIGEQVISGLRPLLLFLDRRSGMRLRIAERRPDIEFDTAVRRYISEFVSLLKVPVYVNGTPSSGHSAETIVPLPPVSWRGQSVESVPSVPTQVIFLPALHSN